MEPVQVRQQSPMDVQRHCGGSVGEPGPWRLRRALLPRGLPGPCGGRGGGSQRIQRRFGERKGRSEGRQEGEVKDMALLILTINNH